MLYLRIADELCTTDVFEEFEKLCLEDTPVVRKILERLEQGKYCNPYSFINRVNFANGRTTSRIKPGSRTLPGLFYTKITPIAKEKTSESVRKI